MTENVLFMEMTWPEIKRAIDRNCVLIFCVGAVEQHGPHMAVGVDTLLPMEVASRVARRIGGIVAPTTNYGYKSILRIGGGPHFVGSIGVSGTTLIAMVKDLFWEFIRHGWRRILVIEWHSENIAFVYDGMEEALRDSSRDDVKIIRIPDINGLALSSDPDLEKFVFGEDWDGWSTEHAAIWETSAMLAAFPDLVKVENIVDGFPPAPIDYDVLPVPKDAAPESGVFGKATAATREKGERILEATTNGLVQVIEQEFHLSG